MMNVGERSKLAVCGRDKGGNPAVPLGVLECCTGKQEVKEADKISRSQTTAVCVLVIKCE